MPIRTVSLNDWTSEDPTRRAVFVRELGAGLEEHGFIALRDSGVPVELVRSAYGAASELFALPTSTKLLCERPALGRQRGYTPFGTEHAKDHDTADLKEFWHVGRASSTALPANVFPAGSAQQPVFDALFSALEGVATVLLEAVGMYLGLSDDTFAELCEDGNSVLRVIHYPPLPANIPAGAVRAAAHEDINLMTVLPVSTASGLEILTREGDWMPVNTEPDTLIADTGDMMALLTGGRLPATTHRVVNPTNPELAAKPRYSLPFFVHPRPEARLTPFDSHLPGPTAQQFLTERLIANGIAAPE